jgi:Gram-negative bacterial TonB protein C-terminal
VSGTHCRFSRSGWFGCLMLLGQLLHAQDIRLHQTAVQLLEKANAASTMVVRPNFEQTVTFQSLDSADRGLGEFRRTSAGPEGHRDETRFGDFHLINIWTADQLIVKGEGRQTPGIVKRMMQSLPIRLVQFDQQDVIRSIDDANVGGRAATCIDFDTVFGTTSQANQICVDKQLGVLLRFREGLDTDENSEFTGFAGAYLPGRIDIYHNGGQILEIHQTFANIEGAVDPAVFQPPMGADIRSKCKQSRRAFGQSMPQPPQGNGGTQVIDVRLRGFIGKDGKVSHPYVLQSDRPDLNEEAVKIVSTWTFTPNLCDGKPNFEQAEFVLHFQGR